MVEPDSQNEKTNPTVPGAHTGAKNYRIPSCAVTAPLPWIRELKKRTQTAFVPMMSRTRKMKKRTQLDPAPLWGEELPRTLARNDGAPAMDS